MTLIIDRDDTIKLYLDGTLKPSTDISMDVAVDAQPVINQNDVFKNNLINSQDYSEQLNAYRRRLVDWTKDKDEFYIIIIKRKND